MLAATIASPPRARCCASTGLAATPAHRAAERGKPRKIDRCVARVLARAGFTGRHNLRIQHVVDERLNAIPVYSEKFDAVFNGGVPLAPGGVTIDMRREAIPEFQTSLVAADAPPDRFIRGDHDAMTRGQNRGALLFFQKGAFGTQDAAIRHHFDGEASLRCYDRSPTAFPATAALSLCEP